MRFIYNKDNATLSAYVKKNDFALAINDEEYRVFEKRIGQESFETFLKNYSNFVKDTFSVISPDEQIQDIISVSTFKNGFTWRSLLDLYYGGERMCFMENMISYSLHTIKLHLKKNSISLSQQDVARLQLMMALVYMPSMPSPFKKDKKYKNVESFLNKKLEILNKKIFSFEKKYKFDSDTMNEYYKDDEIPEKGIKDWLDLYEQRKEILNLFNKQKLIDSFIEEWLKFS